MTDDQIERVLVSVRPRLRKKFKDQWPELEDVVAEAVVVFCKTDPQGCDSHIRNVATLKAESACLKAIATNTRQAGDRARLQPRPRLPRVTKNKDFVLSVRVRADLRVKLESLLDAQGLSVSEYMESLLRQAIDTEVVSGSSGIRGNGDVCQGDRPDA